MKRRSQRDMASSDLRSIARISRAQLRKKLSARVANFYSAAKINANLALNCLATKRPTAITSMGGMLFAGAALHSFFEAERANGRDPIVRKLFANRLPKRRK